VQRSGNKFDNEAIGDLSDCVWIFEAAITDATPPLSPRDHTSATFRSTFRGSGVKPPRSNPAFSSVAENLQPGELRLAPKPALNYDT
jgi:hypothetical protein